MATSSTESKKCTKCGEVKPSSAFHKNNRNKNGLASACKECILKSQKDTYYKDAEASSRKAREKNLRINYGLTVEQYENILTAQGGVCWICKKPCPTGRRLAVDHDHKTGVIRGLLCYRCNKHLVGNHDLETLKAIVKYLEHPPVTQMFGGIPLYVPEGKEKPKRRRRKRIIKRRSP